MRKNKFSLLAGTAALVLSGLSATVVFAERHDIEPSGRGHALRENTPNADVFDEDKGHNGIAGGNANISGEARSSAQVTTTSNNITYHGGPILTTGANIYYIWYGNWGTDTAKTILPLVANGIGGTPYFNINTTYKNGAGQKALNAAHLVAQYTWTATTYGTALTDASVQTIVAATINGGKLAYDPNGVYFVLTSPEVTVGAGTSVAFCKTYCGYHTHFSLNGVATSDVRYAIVGDAIKQCPSSCLAQTALSPNSNPGADGMANVLVHELEEVVTNPALNAWYDASGYENADKCAWQFGTQLTATNKSKYNMTLVNGLKVLIQMNWVNATSQKCALSY